MRNATRVTVSTFGALARLTGIEHGGKPVALVLPGTVFPDFFFGVNNPDLVVYALTLSAFGFLLLTVATGFAQDVQRPIGLHKPPSRSG